MKTTQNKPATLPFGRRFLKTMVALNAALLLGGTAFAGPKQLWVTTISGASGGAASPTARVLTIDGNGNSYIVGSIDNSSGSLSDAFLAKLDANGTVLWTTTISSAGANAFDQFTDAVIDSSGDLVVTGHLREPTGLSEWITAKYDTSGNLSSTWPDVGYGVGIRRITSSTAHCRGSRCLLDSNGDVVVSGTNTNQLVMARYTPTGGLSAVWANNGNGQGIRVYTPGGTVSGSAFVKKDPSGNYYLAGSGVTGSTGQDYIIAKFNSSGTMQWDSKYSANANTFDLVLDLAVDSTGHSYVTGQSQNAALNELNMVLVRFNTGGGGIGWSYRTGAGATGVSVKLDSAGYIYVGGRDETNSTMSVWKFNSSGNLATGSWPSGGGQPAGVRRLGGTVTDAGDDMWLVPASGEIYVTGRVWEVSTPKFTTWKLNASTGTTTWIERFGTTGTDSNGLAVKVGPAGHVIATGITHPFPSGTNQLVVIRYAP